MDPGVGWVIPLAEAAGVDEGLIGGKAAKLAGLARGGFRVPDGFLVTVKAYEHFLESGELARLIRMELGRKPFAAMRWEEIWDVALLVDSRGRYPGEMMKVSAVTVTGRASQVEAGPEFERWAGLLTARHPSLQSFVRAPSTALFRVEVVRCLHVTRFQEVRQWIPASDG